MSERQPQTCSRDFPGTIEAAAEAEAWLTSQSGALGLDPDTEFAINLCVEELFLNAVQPRPRQSGDDFHLGPSPTACASSSSTTASPFDPTVAPAKRISGPTDDFEIGGFGTGLVQKFSRRMSYRRSDGDNRLLLEFDADRDADAGPESQARHNDMKDSSELRAAIRATSAFRDLSEADVSFLIDAGELRTFDAGRDPHGPGRAERHASC